MIEFTDMDGCVWAINSQYVVAIQRKYDTLLIYFEHEDNFFEIEMISVEAAIAVMEQYKSLY